jgi:hypothetical protein
MWTSSGRSLDLQPALGMFHECQGTCLVMLSTDWVPEGLGQTLSH